MPVGEYKGGPSVLIVVPDFTSLRTWTTFQGTVVLLDHRERHAIAPAELVAMARAELASS